MQKEEVEKIKWFNFDELTRGIKEKPESFTLGLISILLNKRIKNAKDALK